MQFLAMMRDGFQEALDAWVFWVVGFVGFLLVFLGLTLSFEPLPLGTKVFATQVANLGGQAPRPPIPGLPPDAQGKQGRRRNPGPGGGMGGLAGAFSNFFAKKDSTAEMIKAEPLEGADGPHSRWSIQMKLSKDVAKSRSKPDNATLIQEEFGKLGKFSLFKVDSVKLDPVSSAPETETYQVEVSPLPGLLRIWPHKLSIFFGGVTIFDATDRPIMPMDSLGQQLILIENYLVAGVGTWVCLLLSVALTAFFVPAMLRKGTIEPLLVRPISRWRLLLYKYLGSILFVSFGAISILGSVWLVLSIRSGLWGYAFLGLIPVLIFYYAFLHAISTLGAVVTRSAVVALVFSCLCWLSLSILQGLYTTVIAMDKVNQVVEVAKTMERKEGAPAEKVVPLSETYFGQTVLFLHRWLPRPGDIDSSVREFLEQDLLIGDQDSSAPNPVASLLEGPNKTDWKDSALITAVYTVLLLAFSCFLFSYRDP